MSIKESWTGTMHDLQDAICNALVQCDGKGQFKEEKWERDGGGGGITRILVNGKVFEKGGVNTSVVYGDVTEKMSRELNINGKKWFACGLSLVIHPLNPFVPTVHCNYRMFELYNDKDEVTDRWFGGGTDLTPYYLFDEDVRHFHQTYKNVCDRFDETFYAKFKINCDNYFVNEHRNGERRGVGGIFYDHQKPSSEKDSGFWLNFSKTCGYALINSYIPIVEKRRNIPFSEANKHWQEIRRGRYVEFNLLHDRGTIFGLKTNGRTESILMSLPPTVRFEYNYQPETGSEEEILLQVCLEPKEWI
jgi:coproporphyrinogen III oxidase